MTDLWAEIDRANRPDDDHPHARTIAELALQWGVSVATAGRTIKGLVEAGKVTQLSVKRKGKRTKVYLPAGVGNGKGKGKKA